MSHFPRKFTQHARFGELDVAKARRAFVEMRLHKRDLMVFYMLIVATYPYHLILLLADPLIAPPAQVETYFVMHFFMMAFGSALALGAAFGFVWLNGMSLAQIGIAAWLAYGLREAAAVHPEWIVVGSKLLTMTIVFELIFCCGHGLVLLVAAASYLGIVVWGYAPYADVMTPMIVDMLTIMGAFVGNVMMLSATERDAGREFDSLIKGSSPHMVVKAALSGKRIQDTFAARRRYCVCVSSDWREYQSLTSQVDPASLATAMSEYYAAISKILCEEVSEGNFFTDWIADELFIVIYGEDETPDANLITAGLDVGVRILEAKREFYVRNGFPMAVDVGLSAGVALVGMLGPKDVAKPTALGDVPGRARRMESAGKILRAGRGVRDRIVFGSDVLTMIQEPREIVEYPLPAGSGLKDLKDRTIFCIEETLDSRKTTASNALQLAQ